MAISSSEGTPCQALVHGPVNIDTNTQTINVGIYLYDAYNNTQTHGDDVILLWAENIPQGGRAPGHVTDHMNGTYFGRVRVHWSGQTRLFVKIASAKKTFAYDYRL